MGVRVRTCRTRYIWSTVIQKYDICKNHDVKYNVLPLNCLLSISLVVFLSLKFIHPVLSRSLHICSSIHTESWYVWFWNFWTPPLSFSRLDPYIRLERICWLIKFMKKKPKKTHTHIHEKVCYMEHTCIWCLFLILEIGLASKPQAGHPPCSLSITRASSRW